jgi:hypothetical protein
MITYVYFPPPNRPDLPRSTREMDDETAARFLGERVLAGWETVSRWVTPPDGKPFNVAYVLSYDGRVWALYIGG